MLFRSNNQILSELENFVVGADLPSLGIPDNKPWTLLQAYIMSKIYFDVFDKPFFGVDKQFSMADKAKGGATDGLLEHYNERGSTLREGLEMLYAEFNDRKQKVSGYERLLLTWQAMSKPHLHGGCRLFARCDPPRARLMKN